MTRQHPRHLQLAVIPTRLPTPGSRHWLPFTRNNVSEIPVQQVENRVTSPFLIQGEFRFAH